MKTLHERLEAAYDYLREQLTESSTVRGVITLATLAGGTIAKLPPDVTLMGALVLSQLLKILLPDDLFFLKRKP
jgi:hypothetical protein